MRDAVSGIHPLSPRRTWLGGVLALVLAACLPPSASDLTWKPSGAFVSCTFAQVEGKLVAIDGRTAIVGARFMNIALPEPLFVRWPEGWQVRSVLGELEIVNAAGSFVGRTGNFVAIDAAAGAAGSPGSPNIVDGVLLACP